MAKRAIHLPSDDCHHISSRCRSLEGPPPDASSDTVTQSLGERFRGEFAKIRHPAFETLEKLQFFDL
jgi:hypothetical protein